MIRKVLLIFAFILMFGYSQDKKTRIALINFNAIGIEEVTVRGIEENLLTEIINTGRFEVIERSQLNKVLQELNLSNSDEFTESTAAQVGNLLGVDIILIGSVNKLGKNISINVRGIEVKTGLASFAKKVVTKSEEDLITAIENLSVMISTATKEGDNGLSQAERDKIEQLKKEAEEKKRAEEEAAKKKAEEEEAAKKKKEQAKTLSGTKIGGIALVTTGGILLVGGVVIFAVDMAVLGPKTSNAQKSGDFKAFKEAQTLDLAMFGTGIGLMGVGGILAICSIPLFVAKDKSVSLDLGFGTTTSLGMKIKF